MRECKKCKIEKSFKDFYGDCYYSSLCKECTKEKSKLQRSIMIGNKDWCEKEKIRSREKYHRLGYGEKYKKASKVRPESQGKKITIQKYKEKYPEKYYAKIGSQRVKKSIKTNHLHHWSYNKYHWKDVIELTVLEHHKAHRYMTYDQEQMMYRTIKGVLLDTKEAHLNYITEEIKELP